MQNLPSFCLTITLFLGVGCSSEEKAPDAPELPEVVNCEVDPNTDQGRVVSFNPLSVAESDETFPLGVQAGWMTQTEVVLWSFAQDNATKTLRVWREAETEGDTVLVVDQPVEPVDGYLKTKVEGLAPRTTYHYAFLEGSDGSFQRRSTVGRFLTAFPDGCLAPLMIGGTHGTNYKRAPFEALNILAERKPDIYVHLGDLSYNDSAVKGAEEKAEEEIVALYRQEWRKTFDVSGYKEVNAAAGQYVVWDDHEVVDNSKLYELDEAIKEIGKKAFFETTTVERRENGSYWRSFRWGRTAEFFALDCRHERLQESANTPGATYISEEQMSWLKTGLLESPAHFRVVLNSVPITEYPPLVIFDDDRWQGFARQREEILNFIELNGIERVLWLTGDFHLGTVNRIERAGPRSNMWEIMMGPGGNKDNPMWGLVNACFVDRDEIAPADQFPFFGGQYMATFVELNPVRDTVRAVFIDSETRELLYDGTMQVGGAFPSAPLPGGNTCE